MTFFWGSSLKINQDVVIAIVDTGVDYNHPDLSAQMWKNGAGFHGFDFENNDTDPMDDNNPGHGTHVAGLAAATSGNGIGISGVMGYHAKIMAVKVMDQDGSGSITNIVNGIRYAVASGAHIINMSLGGRGSNTALSQALTEAVDVGVVVLVAAGNDGEELTSTNLFSPASYGSKIAGMLTVGAIDTKTIDRSNFSNYSTTYVELGAPGSQAGSAEGILSTLPGDDYGNLRGTSMATPVASGATALVIGLLKSNGKSFSPADVERIMRDSAIKSAVLKGEFVTGNQLDLLQTALYLQNSYIFTGDAGLESQ